jgi:hypothetical protein
VLGPLVLVACSKHTPPVTTATSNAPPPVPFASSAEATFDKDDPCNLLDPKDVEAALGAPLAVPPFRAGDGPATASADGDTCVYETAKFRYITLEVTREGGQRVYSMSGMTKGLLKSSSDAQIQNNVKKNFKLDDGTEMTGEWDEASLMAMNCCIFMAMRGDQLITIDFTAAPATLRQAATLVDGAYKRMDNPLKIDGGGAIAAAKALDKTRPAKVPVCSILSRAEVEAILGALSEDPVPAGESVCRYNLPPVNNAPQQYELSVRWRGGYYEWRSDHHVASIGHASMTQIVNDVTGGHAPQGMSKGEEDASAAAGVDKPQAASDPAEGIDKGLIGGFRSVKKDVLVGVNGMFIDQEKEKALLSAVLQKI